MDNNKSNKPIALAVTLVILVICLMLCIVFISKNIALNQDKQVETGQSIVSLIEKVQTQAHFVNSVLVADMIDVSQTSSEQLAKANSVMQHELERLSADLNELFLTTREIDATLFSEASLTPEASKLAIIIERLEDQSYLSDENLFANIKELSEQLLEITNDFNFLLGNSKTAMIRMSNGFEWVETLQAIDSALYSNIE